METATKQPMKLSCQKIKPEPESDLSHWSNVNLTSNFFIYQNKGNKHIVNDN